MIREPEVCKTQSCQALIDFAETEAGKMMPVDRDSIGRPGGTLAVRVGDGGALFCRTLASPTAELRPGEKLGTSHYVTCKRPAEHRRR